MIRGMKNKDAQVTIFIILALVIIGGIVIYFAVRGNLFAPQIPAEFQPVYDYYSSCIAEQTSAAIDLAGSQGGYVYLPTYFPGSEYAPSSSELNFLGFPVPYWYYISGNGVIREQVPTKSDIEGNISQYVADRVNNCDFSRFYAQGFSINFTPPKVSVTIADTAVSVNVNAPLIVSRENQTAVKSSFSESVDSKLGKFYNLALEIYDKEKSDAFLEGYAVDVLRLYAPVDGAELSCAPKIWKTRDVVDSIRSGLEANTAAIKLKGGYYQLASKENEYFVVNQPVDESINFVYNRNWPSKIQIQGANNDLMIATPVGTQEGMGVMGFCYAPYHFVYDLNYPVLIQIYDNTQIFQFPVVVVIDKNMPRKAVFSEITEDNRSFDLCEFKTQDITVNAYDVSLNHIDANISFSCFDQLCDLGQTENGIFNGQAPQCANGYLIVSAGGYATNKQLFSSNTESSADVILDREYNTLLNLQVGGKPLDGRAVISFNGPKSVSAALPEMNNISLLEGLYNVTVYVYGNSSIVIPASTKTQCQEVNQGGIAGLFGATQQQCFNIDVPATNISYALIGGGQSQVYLLSSDLEKGNLNISVDSLPFPNSIDQLANNFNLFENQGVTVSAP